jgi:hypothetical protein
MPNRIWIVMLLLVPGLFIAAIAQDGAGTSMKLKALKVAPPSAAGTWAILDRDGANRPVARYLSSLGGGESGTGVIASPPFRIATDTITFTICGHDGQGGGQKNNYIALVDAKTGKTLRQTMAPGADAMQPRSWDVAKLRPREVVIEVHDGDSGGAFAWLGIGRIDAGSPLRVGFAQGMPDGWIAKTEPIQPRTELVPGGIPFLRYPAVYSMVPASGALEIPCGFSAERLFFLGCTVSGGRPTESYGTIEIVYRSGPAQRCPLICGYTLDVAGKRLSDSKAMYLHASGDVFKHYLVLAPRRDVIEKVILRRDPKQEAIPRITAITCMTDAASEHLAPLPDGAVGTEEAAWIESHAITPTSPDMEQITVEIHRANKVP